MLDLLSVTLPIFLLIALGFVAAKAGVLDQTFIRDLGLFVLNFALPALVLHALLAQDLRRTFNGHFVLAYAGGSLVVFLIMLAVFRIALRREQSRAALAALGSVASNSGFVGFPVASLAVGAPALAALPMAMLVENMLIIPLGLGLAEAGRGSAGRWPRLIRDSAVRLIRMPLVLAIIAGIVLSALRLHPPQFLSTGIGMLANASAACALLTVGGTLAAVQPAKVAGDVSLIVLAKLVLHPASVAAGLWLVGGVTAPMGAAALILAAAPMLTVYPIFGQRFGLGPLCSMALLAATVLSFGTLTVLIGFLLTDGMTQLSPIQMREQ